uniref:Uncharacterized protein n=1 Tax=Varanus komodoensis TaxID=61221 RepID=A0A8D2LGD0_VARKO
GTPRKWGIHFGTGNPADSLEVRQNFENCKQFFYKAQAPTWPSDVQLKHICQYYENHYYFATLYHQGFRIPYWSAYTLKSGDSNPGRRSTWYIEPLVDDPGDPLTPLTPSVPDLKQSQALNVDYENTAYDRGHLNPNSFQSGNGRDATFTLTNAVPMDSCFNQIRWAQLEKMLRSELLEHCIGNGGTPYLVTGAETDWTRDYSRVSVPDYIWTAVCCDNPLNQDLKFSFSVLAENSEKPFLLVLPVRMLENDLKQYYEKHHTFPPGHSLRIFADDCNENSATGQLVLERIKNSVFQSFQDMISNGYSLWFPETQMAGSDQLPSPGTSGTPGSLDSLRVTDMKFSLGFRDRQEWHNHYEKLYSENNMACVLSSISGSPMFRHLPIFQVLFMPLATARFYSLNWVVPSPLCDPGVFSHMQRLSQPTCEPLSELVGVFSEAPTALSSATLPSPSLRTGFWRGCKVGRREQKKTETQEFP